MKLVRETKKILGDNTIAVTATAVRVPVVGGHSGVMLSLQTTLM
jgi:aspartate-semialdehyde dehydrogenase